MSDLKEKSFLIFNLIFVEVVATFWLSPSSPKRLFFNYCMNAKKKNRIISKYLRSAEIIDCSFLLFKSIARGA